MVEEWVEKFDARMKRIGTNILYMALMVIGQYIILAIVVSTFDIRDRWLVQLLFIVAILSVLIFHFIKHRYKFIEAGIYSIINLILIAGEFFSILMIDGFIIFGVNIVVGVLTPFNWILIEWIRKRYFKRLV